MTKASSDPTINPATAPKVGVSGHVYLKARQQLVSTNASLNTKLTCQGRSQSNPIGITPSQAPVTVPTAGYTSALSTGVRGLDAEISSVPQEDARGPWSGEDVRELCEETDPRKSTDQRRTVRPEGRRTESVRGRQHGEDGEKQGHGVGVKRMTAWGGGMSTSTGWTLAKGEEGGMFYLERGAPSRTAIAWKVMEATRVVATAFPYSYAGRRGFRGGAYFCQS